MLCAQTLTHGRLLAKLDRMCQALPGPLRGIHKTPEASFDTGRVLRGLSTLAIAGMLGLSGVAHLLEVLIEKKEDVASFTLLCLLLLSATTGACIGYLVLVSRL